MNDMLPLIFELYNFGGVLSIEPHGFSNVVFSYGAERFISACKEIEMDGLILPYLPFEEKEEFLPVCHQYGIDLVSLIAPTSENRIAMIAKESCFAEPSMPKRAVLIIQYISKAEAA